MTFPSEIERRFWAKVNKTDACWLWTRSTSGRGYGQAYTGTGIMLAHRMSWIMANGPIPVGMMVLHRCDVKRCVRPSHLFLGTAKDNSQDMASKQRSPSGERHYKAALTDEQIRLIARMWADGLEGPEIARLFRVSEGHAWALATGKAPRAKRLGIQRVAHERRAS